MKIHHLIGPRADRPRLALAIGVFDGVHRGHRALLDVLRPHVGPGCVLAALSFRNHPVQFLRPHEAPPLIMTLEERVNRLAAIGVAELYLAPFDAALANMDARAFLDDVLLRDLNVSAVAVGVSFRFGAQRQGDIVLARAHFAAAGIPFHAVEHVCDEGERVSSTRVRCALAAADLPAVDRLLAEPYSLTGEIELGAGRGHDLGFPTANLRLAPGLAIPPDGVYTARIRHDGTAYVGLVSIGTNPTFGQSARTVEVWIRDFDRTVYGQQLRVDEVRFLRGQQRFESIHGLKQQMHQDAAALDNTVPPSRSLR